MDEEGCDLLPLLDAEPGDCECVRLWIWDGIDHGTSIAQRRYAWGKYQEEERECLKRHMHEAALEAA